MTRIERIAALDEAAFAPLLAASEREGWRHVARLVAEWRDGVQRFSAPGEGLFVTRDARDTILAVAGVSVDPYADKAEIGRLRRVYVDPSWRRRGIGAALTRHALEAARPSFRELRLRTTDAAAAAFYSLLGFERVTHLDGTTHRIVLLR